MLQHLHLCTAFVLFAILNDDRYKRLTLSSKTATSAAPTFVYLDNCCAAAIQQERQTSDAILFRMQPRLEIDYDTKCLRGQTCQPLDECRTLWPLLQQVVQYERNSSTSQFGHFCCMHQGPGLKFDNMKFSGNAKFALACCTRCL